MSVHFSPAISDNKDYGYAFDEILHYCYTMEMDGAQRPVLALILMSAALETMDYVDYLDFTRHLESDPEKNRLMRLSNFSEYLREYTEKRTILMEEGDSYLAGRLARYKSTRTTVKVLEGRGVHGGAQGKLPAADALALVQELQENLLIQGLQRFPVARALVDAAFLYAKMAGDDVYAQLCHHVQAETGQALQGRAVLNLIEKSAGAARAMSESDLRGMLEEYGAFVSTTIH